MKINTQLQFTRYSNKKALESFLKVLNNQKDIANTYDATYIFLTEEQLNMTTEELKNIRYIAGLPKGGTNDSIYSYSFKETTTSPMDIYNSKMITNTSDFIIKYNIPKDRSINNFNLINIVNHISIKNDLNDVNINHIPYVLKNTDYYSDTHLQNNMGWNNNTSVYLDRVNKKIYLLVSTVSGKYTLKLYIIDLYTRDLINTIDLTNDFPNIYNFKIFVENGKLYINEYTWNTLKSYNLTTQVKEEVKNFSSILHSTSNGNYKVIMTYDYKNKVRYLAQITNDRDKITNKQIIYLHKLDSSYDLVNTIRVDVKHKYVIDNIFIEDLDRNVFYTNSGDLLYLHYNGVRTYTVYGIFRNVTLCENSNLMIYTDARSIGISSLPINYAFAKTNELVTKKEMEDINIDIKVRLKDNNYFLFE